MKYFPYKLEKQLLSNKFKKIIYDGKVKIFSKNLNTPNFRYQHDRIMIIPEWYTFIKENNENPTYIVEIWPQDYPNSSSYKLWGKEKLVLEMANFLEKLHNQWL